MPTFLTRAQARDHDRRCVQELGLPGIVLMENAARGCADLALRMLPRNAPARAIVICGAGQNGGDGYAIARHLAIAGVQVRVVALGEPSTGSDAGVMRRVALAMGLPVESWAGAPGLAGADLLVDALFGTGLDRPVTGDALEAIRGMRQAGAAVLSVDLPSGMHADTGEPMPECVHATLTATMVAPKAGFARPQAAACLGRVEIVGIGAPAPHG